MLELLHMPFRLILLLFTFSMSRNVNAHQNELLELSSLINERISLPCNVSKHALQDQPQAILWFQNELATGPPIFALDLRSSNQQHYKSANHPNQTGAQQFNLDVQQTILDSQLTWEGSTSVNSNYTKSTNEAFLRILQSATSFVSDSYKDRVHFNVTNELPSLIIDKIKEDDQGVYLCRIDYKWARTKSFSVNLQVIVPPKALYIKDKSEQRVYAIAGPYNEDDSLDLMCIAEHGKPPPRLLWYLNQTVIDDTFTIKDTVRSRINGQQNKQSIFSSILNTNITQPSTNSSNHIKNALYWVENSLHVPRLTRNYYNSILTCQALRDHNSFTPKSISLRIDMHLKPVEVAIRSPKISLIAGNPVEIVCEASGSKPPADITWLLNDKQINCNRNCTQTISPNEDEPSTTTSVLKLTPSVHHQNARLTCRANNVILDQHYIQDHWILAVHFKPVLNLVLLGEHDFAIEHHTIALQCNVKSNPPLVNRGNGQIQWFFNGQSLSPDNKEMNQINNSLLIGNVSKSKHEGSYSCEAENALSIGKSNVFQLYIHNVPKCKSHPKLITARPNQNIKLICEYQPGSVSLINHSTNGIQQSLANLTFHWTKQTEILDSEGHLTISYRPITNSSSPDRINQTQNNLSKLHSHSGLNRESTLDIQIDKPSDYGLVICEASNFVGRADQPCKFLIKPPLERPEVPQICSFSMANHSLMNEFEDSEDRTKYDSNQQQEDVKPLFTLVHHHNGKLPNNQLHSTEQLYSTFSTSPTLSLVNGHLLDHQFTSSKSVHLPPSKDKLLIIDCTASNRSESRASFNFSDSVIYHQVAHQPTTFQFELWRESDEHLLLINKKTIHKPRFIINYSQLTDDWSEQEFVYSIYILAFNNQGKSDHLLKFTFNHPEQLLEEPSKLKHRFKLIPFSMLFDDQKARNQSKLLKSSNFTRPFTLLSADSLYKEKNQNEQQLNNMARHGSNGKQFSMDKLRKNILGQSIEETEQRAEERNQLPSTHHQLNRISNGGNDGSKLTATRNNYSNLHDAVQSNGLTLNSGRLMMISGVCLICLTVFISLFCYFRLRAKQLLIDASTNNGLNDGSPIDNTMDSKQSLGESQCALSSISATLLQQSNLSNLKNGTINSFQTFADNLNTDHGFIITQTGALHAFGDHTFVDPCTANLTIYSNQPTINYDNYTETNQNKLQLLPDQTNLESKQYFHFNSTKCDSTKLITPDLIELSCDSLQIVMEHQQKMYSELLSIEKPTHLHVEIQDQQDIGALMPHQNLTNSTVSDQQDESVYGQHVFCVSTQV